MRKRNAIVGTPFMLVALPFVAHHSTLTQSVKDRVAVQGVITKIDWSNPHVIFYLDARDNAGKLVTWTIETGSPNELTAVGIAKETFRSGRELTLRGAVRRNKLEVPAADLPGARQPGR